MDTRLEQIRQNLVSASAHLERIYPAAPPELRTEVNQAWQHYYQLVQQQNLSTPRPGKKNDDFGFIVALAIASAVGIASIMGGSAYITHELSESELLNKITKCVEENTKQGISLPAAQTACNKLYRGEKKSLFDIQISPMMILGGFGVLGLILLLK